MRGRGRRGQAPVASSPVGPPYKRGMLDHEVVPAVAGRTDGACVVLHGLGDSREGWRPVASAFLPPTVATVLVDAPDPYYGGFAWFPIPGMTAPEHTQADMEAGIRRSRGLLRELIDHLLVDLRLESRQLMLLGFSQGCCMALDAALRDPRTFAGVVGISGFVADLDDLPAGLSPVAREQSILWTHGHYDPVVPLDWAEACHQALRGFGLEPDFRLYAKDHTVDPEHELPEMRRWIAQRFQHPTRSG